MRTKLSDIDKKRLELGKMLQNFYEMGFISKRRLIGFSLLKGIFTGIGVFLGSTLGIALLLWLLNIFHAFPLIGEIVNNIQDKLH